MRTSLVVVVFLLSFIHIQAQEYILNGHIVDRESGSPVDVASVLLRNADTTSIVSYTYTNDLGEFTLKMKEAGEYLLTISCLGYKGKTLPFHMDSLQTTSYLKIAIDKQALNLDEIIIRTERPAIVVKGDTVKVQAKYFSTGNEDNVEELLQKIPGINVDDKGTIRVGNQEIDKLMVDGSDFFEKGYKILSKNMPAYPIEAIEIIKNYTSNPLLRDISNEDKVVLNLNLKEEAKGIWFGNMNGKLSLNSYYSLRSNLMNFGKKNKFYFLTNLNNLGYSSIVDINYMIQSSMGDSPTNVGNNQQLKTLINAEVPRLPFSNKTANFNNSKLLSLNGIFDVSDKIKLKVISFANIDKTDFFKNSTEEVNTLGTRFSNTEQYELASKIKLGFGKIETTYNISNNKLLTASTIFKVDHINNNAQLSFNNLSATEDILNHENTRFEQNINYTQKISKKKVYLLSGQYIFEKNPQLYDVRQIDYRDLFQEFPKTNRVSQDIQQDMHLASVNAQWVQKTENNQLFELHAGNEFKKERLYSSFSLLEDNRLESIPAGYQNNTSLLVNDLYFKSKYSYLLQSWVFSGNLNIHQLINQIDQPSQQINQTPLYIQPTISALWNINAKNKFITSYSYNRANAGILDIYDGYVLTHIRSFSKGSESFNPLSVSTLLLNYNLGSWGDRLFANAMVIFNKNHDYYTSQSTIDQFYSLSEKIYVKNSSFVSVNTQVDYFLKSISSNIKLDLGYFYNTYSNVVNESDLRQIESNTFTYGVELRSGFSSFINFHAGTKWTANSISTVGRNSNTDNLSFLDLYFDFSEKINLKIEFERYFFGAYASDNQYLFLDFEVDYELIDDKLIIGLNGNNLFNTRYFRNYFISDLGTTTTEYRILPRYITFNAEYRF